MPEPYVGRNEITAPGWDVEAVTASDSADLPDGECKALLVGTAGAATLIMASGETRTAVPLQQGYNPLRVRRVFSTGLGASNIWAVY